MHSQSVSYIALELKEDYLKAYVRRAQAYEALEKYEDALEGSCMCTLSMCIMMCSLSFRLQESLGVRSITGCS